ncbi:hypothetical protein [Paenibacillus azoreducens]|uniref:Lipoprotein n=1 Tax=Paenibacillus azoreducens TaxID=116718 RepID=A0A919YCX2_9BACL|nr:hypothetical protein [Paenibacillus azoreducens]GIO49311.1 hypothetical protein J34TS1_40760 [Paenibacillus azoreducens]
MTKKAFLLLLFCIFILCSCSIQDRKDEENVHLTPKEPTLRLKIAVLENMQYPPMPQKQEQMKSNETTDRYLG